MARKMARDRLRKRVADELLRAGPAAIRAAMKADESLAGFLDPADLAQLAEYSKPPPAKPDVIKSVDPLKMNRWSLDAIEDTALVWVITFFLLLAVLALTIHRIVEYV